MSEDKTKQSLKWHERLKNWIVNHPASSLLIGCATIIFLLMVIFPDIFPDWFGLSELKDDSSGAVIRERKTLWDWLDLFIVSFVVSFALFWLNKSQKQRELSREENREELDNKRQEKVQQQTRLLDYYDKMSKLIVDKNLGILNDQVTEKAVVVARAITLATFRSLEPSRNAAVLRFLGDAGIAGVILQSKDLAGVDFSNSDLSYVDLTGAHLGRSDLSNTTLSWSNLSEADLRKANLSKATITETIMNEARLIGADLREASLFRTKLKRARLTNVKFRGASLFGVNLSGASLIGVDLAGIDLEGCNLSGASLHRADLSKSKLQTATLTGAKFTKITDGDLPGSEWRNTKWPPDFDPIAAGAIVDNSQFWHVEEED